MTFNFKKKDIDITKNKWSEQNIGLAIAKLYNKKNFCVFPNVSFGFGLDYEADLLAVSKTGVITEIEIKISITDLKADFKKKKHTKERDPRIKHMYYAMPDEIFEINKTNTLIPAYAGIYLIKREGLGTSVKEFRKPMRLSKYKIMEYQDKSKPGDSDFRYRLCNWSKLAWITNIKYWNLIEKLEQYVDMQ